MVSQQKERDWAVIRKQYETTSVSLRNLAKSLSIPESTMLQRSMREHWMQAAKLVRRSAHDVKSKLQAAVKAKVESELAPWIEAEKVRFTKEGHKLAITGVKRVNRYFKANRVVEPKGESMIAKAASDYHRIGRVALGMSDGSPVSGSVNLNILTNQAAIAVAPDSDARP